VKAKGTILDEDEVKDGTIANWFEVLGMFK
jgi:hypothetical protein